MTRNAALGGETLAAAAGQSGKQTIVLVGLMGAGKTAVGRRLAARLGLPFRDSDVEIETAAGRSVPELFESFGEPYFRAGERQVIQRLLREGPIVLATGGGAFMDPATRAAIRASAISVWLRAALPVLIRRVSTRRTRPLLANGDPAEILSRLMAERYPTYAEADIVIDCADDSLDQTTRTVAATIAAWSPPHVLPVRLPSSAYDIVVGSGLLSRAGALLAPVLPQKRAIVVTDRIVAALHLQTLLDGLAVTGVETATIVVSPGEASKSLAGFGRLMNELLAARPERGTTIIALGGGVVGDLAGFAAATALRGLPFVQAPTTLLAQVDSSVGGKTGINADHGKNLIGAFHQPRMVLADTATLATLPPREKSAGYAEIIKAGLIGDASFYDWCEVHGGAVVADNQDAQTQAILRACAFKAAVVGDDEREERADNGRALLNLGHTFAHALEAECGYGAILHGEAVTVGLGLACRLSARLGLCDPAIAERVAGHVAAVGLPADLGMLNRRFSAARLLELMQRDKKMRDGQLRFVLLRGIGQAFTSGDVPATVVTDVLREAGCDA